MILRFRYFFFFYSKRASYVYGYNLFSEPLTFSFTVGSLAFDFHSFFFFYWQPATKIQKFFLWQRTEIKSNMQPSSNLKTFCSSTILLMASTIKNNSNCVAQSKQNSYIRSKNLITENWEAFQITSCSARNGWEEWRTKGRSL